jgi:hypothetical protein
MTLLPVSRRKQEWPYQVIFMQEMRLLGALFIGRPAIGLAGSPQHGV